MGGRINTIMQTCFFAICGVLPREEAIEAIKDAIEKTYGKSGDEVGAEELRGGRRDARAPARGARARPGEQRARDAAAGVGADAPTFVRDVLGAMIAGKGDMLPVSALPIDGTFPTGTAQWEKRNIAQRDSRLGREAVHPVRQMRAGLPARGRSAPRSTTARSSPSAPPTFKSTKPNGASSKRMQLHAAGFAGGLHRLRLCVEVCPAKSKSEVKHKAINMEPQPPLREAEKRQLGFLPGAAGRRSRCAAAQPRQGRAAARAAVRILRRLRRLRRDALHQAADPAVRRPPDDRQRDRLLLDLWRQPADHALHA